MKFDIEHLKRLAERLDYKPESQQHKDNLAAYCNSDRMMSIAEAFRVLEQRAEAAEARLKELEAKPFGVKLPKVIPKSVYQVIYRECGGFVDCGADAQKIWEACRKAAGGIVEGTE